jgi:hypothetical protein
MTTDAQAFLRRILETAAPNVEFALEVRDESTMNPPLLSRCQQISMGTVSIRKQNAIAALEKRGYADLRRVRQQMEQRMAGWSPGTSVASVCEAVDRARSQGLLPEVLLGKLLAHAPTPLQVEMYTKLGDGVSPWILLTHVAMQSCVS